jgi:hypothetical protein
MVLIKLLATLMGWNISQTHRLLTDPRIPIFRQMCGIPKSKIPPRRTLSYRWHNKKVLQLQQRVFKRLLRELINSRSVKVMLIDMSDLPVSVKDQLARWGYCSKGRFWGYKFYLVTTCNGIPVAVVVSRANEVEPNASESLLNKVERILRDDEIESIAYFVGDAAFDGEVIYDDVERLFDGQLVCAVNPRRDEGLKELRGRGELPQEKEQHLREMEDESSRAKGILLYASEEGKRLYGRRIFLEQTIDLLKVDLRMGEIPYWVRGVRKVLRWVLDHLFLFVSIAYCNKLHRRPLRQVAPYLV